LQRGKRAKIEITRKPMNAQGMHRGKVAEIKQFCCIPRGHVDCHS